MLVDCPFCIDGDVEGVTCTVCSGNGELSLTDEAFKYVRAAQRRVVEGQVWAEMLDKLDNILDKCNDIFDKCNDIFEKVNEP